MLVNIMLVKIIKYNQVFLECYSMLWLLKVLDNVEWECEKQYNIGKADMKLWE